MDEHERAEGLGTVAQGGVIVAVFAVVLTGMLVLAERQAAIAEVAAVSPTPAQSDPPARPSTEATPLPGPDAAGPGTYTVQPGDSLFSVAADLGLDPDALIFWNKETYPRMQSTPALTPGWVLVTDGPPLPTPIPDETPAPSLPEPQTAGPDGVLLPVFGPTAFPASEAVTVEYYTVRGASILEIAQSMSENGPFAEWIGGSADAAVDFRLSFDFWFNRSSIARCRIQLMDATPIDPSYHVTLPNWEPPADAPASLVEWWVGYINDTVAHERHHIEVWESYLPRMNRAVLSGTCDSVEDDLLRIYNRGSQENCEFDLEEYGFAAGLTLEDCLSS